LHDVAKRVLEVEDAREINCEVRQIEEFVSSLFKPTSYPWPKTFSTSGHRVVDASSPPKGRLFCEIKVDGLDVTDIGSLGHREKERDSNLHLRLCWKVQVVGHLLLLAWSSVVYFNIFPAIIV
jgi:hypothetical protein